MRAKARALLLEEKPSLLIGSPPRTAFSSWKALNAARLGWTAKDVKRRRAEGELHVRFCTSEPLLPARAPCQRHVVAAVRSTRDARIQRRAALGGRSVPLRTGDRRGQSSKETDWMAQQFPRDSEEASEAMPWSSWEVHTARGRRPCHGVREGGT